MKAIKKGFFASWSGLPEKSVQQNFPESEDMQRGHMKEKPSVLRSTKVKVPVEGNPTYDHESASEEEAQHKKEHKDIFCVGHQSTR